MAKARVIRSALGATLVALLAQASIVIAQDATDPWLVCLAQKSRELAESPDSASVVADAAMALCRSKEPQVRALVEARAMRDLVAREVVADEAEARSVLNSTHGAGWQEYRTVIASQVAASVVQTRAGQQQRRDR